MIPRSLVDDVHALFPTLARSLLPPFLEVLERARAILGGDMEKVIIVLVVGVRSAEHADFARASHAELLAAEVLPGLGINVRSIADSVGMPKETVRRKVQELVADRVLTRRQNRLYVLGEGYRRLTPAREAFERLVAGYYEALASIAVTPEPVDGVEELGGRD